MGQGAGGEYLSVVGKRYWRVDLRNEMRDDEKRGKQDLCRDCRRVVERTITYHERVGVVLHQVTQAGYHAWKTAVDSYSFEASCLPGRQETWLLVGCGWSLSDLRTRQSKNQATNSNEARILQDRTT